MKNAQLQVQLGLISDFRQDESIKDAMMSAGLTVQLTENNQSSIAKAMTWYKSRIREKEEPLNSFGKGRRSLAIKNVNTIPWYACNHNFYTAVATLSVNCISMHLLTTTIHSLMQTKMLF